jgi:three-Cys-motif partner protein
MKARWDVRVYIDLFAGPGKVRIEGTTKVVDSSPLIVLKISDPFDRYIFCEKDPDLLAALETRVKTLHPSRDVHFLQGDANEFAGRILETMPPYGSRKKVLAFCFADPFKLRNLQFSTIHTLANRFVDFLILLPTGMDANRNWNRYMNPTNDTVDLFVGTSQWRDAWQQAIAKGSRVDVFLMDFYRQQMKKLGYHYGGVESSVLVRSTEKNFRSIVSASSVAIGWVTSSGRRPGSTARINDLYLNNSTGGFADGTSFFHRVDGSHLEPCDRLYENQPGVQALLRRTHGKASAGHGAGALPKWISDNAPTGSP